MDTESRICLRDVESEEDLRFLMDLRNQNLQYYLTQTPIDWEMQRQWWERASEDTDHRYLVAWHQGQRIGMGRLHGIESDPVGIGGDIEERFRGQGLGRNLFETLIALCRHTYDAESIWLEVLTANHRAINLYISLGFKEVKRSEKALRMELLSPRTEGVVAISTTVKFAFRNRLST